MKHDESLCSKKVTGVKTPIDAINNLIFYEGEKVFEYAVCFYLIEAIQDRSYLKPILLKTETMNSSTAYRIVDMVNHLHCISVVRSGN